MIFISSPRNACQVFVVNAKKTELAILVRIPLKAIIESGNFRSLLITGSPIRTPTLLTMKETARKYPITEEVKQNG